MINTFFNKLIAQKNEKWYFLIIFLVYTTTILKYGYIEKEFYSFYLTFNLLSIILQSILIRNMWKRFSSVKYWKLYFLTTVSFIFITYIGFLFSPAIGIMILTLVILGHHLSNENRIIINLKLLIQMGVIGYFLYQRLRFVHFSNYPPVTILYIIITILLLIFFFSNKKIENKKEIICTANNLSFLISFLIFFSY